jgi:hypothetical protein
LSLSLSNLTTDFVQMVYHARHLASTQDWDICEHARDIARAVGFSLGALRFNSF